MSKWCNTCHRNELTGEWQPCDPSCPAFGKDFESLVKVVVSSPGLARKGGLTIKDLDAVLRSSRGDIQFAIVYDVDENRDIATCSVEYAVKTYGDWYLDRITGTAVDDDAPGALVLHVRKEN